MNPESNNPLIVGDAVAAPELYFMKLLCVVLLLHPGIAWLRDAAPAKRSGASPASPSRTFFRGFHNRRGEKCKHILCPVVPCLAVQSSDVLAQIRRVMLHGVHTHRIHVRQG